MAPKATRGGRRGTRPASTAASQRSSRRTANPQLEPLRDDIDRIGRRPRTRGDAAARARRGGATRGRGVQAAAPQGGTEQRIQDGGPSTPGKQEQQTGSIERETGIGNEQTSGPEQVTGQAVPAPVPTAQTPEQPEQPTTTTNQEQTAVSAQQPATGEKGDQEKFAGSGQEGEKGQKRPSSSEPDDADKSKKAKMGDAGGDGQHPGPGDQARDRESCIRLRESLARLRAEFGDPSAGFDQDGQAFRPTDATMTRPTPENIIDDAATAANHSVGLNAGQSRVGSGTTTSVESNGASGGSNAQGTRAPQESVSASASRPVDAPAAPATSGPTGPETVAGDASTSIDEQAMEVHTTTAFLNLPPREMTLGTPEYELRQRARQAEQEHAAEQAQQEAQQRIAAAAASAPPITPSATSFQPAPTQGDDDDDGTGTTSAGEGAQATQAPPPPSEDSHTGEPHIEIGDPDGGLLDGLGPQDPESDLDSLFDGEFDPEEDGAGWPRDFAEDLYD